jgi:hypothetical protein
MEKSISHVLTYGFTAFALFVLYQTYLRFNENLIVTASLTLLTAAMTLLAAYFSLKKRWYVVIVFVLIAFTVGDLAGVYFAARR